MKLAIKGVVSTTKDIVEILHTQGDYEIMYILTSSKTMAQRLDRKSQVSM